MAGCWNARYFSSPWMVWNVSGWTKVVETFVFVKRNIRMSMTWPYTKNEWGYQNLFQTWWHCEYHMYLAKLCIYIYILSMYITVYHTSRLICFVYTRWSLLVMNGVTYNWPYKQVTGGYFTLLIGVISLHWKLVFGRTTCTIPFSCFYLVLWSRFFLNVYIHIYIYT